jgi:hypothetical protein
VARKRAEAVACGLKPRRTTRLPIDVPPQGSFQARLAPAGANAWSSGRLSTLTPSRWQQPVSGRTVPPARMAAGMAGTTLRRHTLAPVVGRRGSDPVSPDGDIAQPGPVERRLVASAGRTRFLRIWRRRPDLNRRWRSFSLRESRKTGLNSEFPGHSGRRMVLELAQVSSRWLAAGIGRAWSGLARAALPSPPDPRSGPDRVPMTKACAPMTESAGRFRTSQACRTKQATSQ